MKNQIWNWLRLMLVFFLPGIATLPAQNPNWAIVPSQADFTTSNLSVQAMPGNYQTPVHCSNSAHDAQGNLLFYVVDDAIFDDTGMQIASLGTGFGYFGKELIIIPDPGDCDARLILSGSFDFILNGGPDNYEWAVNITRIKKSGANWSVQDYYFLDNIYSNNNGFMSMAVSKPLNNGERFWYVITSDYITQYRISSTGIQFIQNAPVTDGEAPTDAEISPSGDRLMWADAGNYFELLWTTLNPVTGAMLSQGHRPLDYTGEYDVYGIEFEDNTHVLVSAVRQNGSGVNSGIIRCDFNTPVASQVVANASFSTSQLERALDGKIYATSGTELLGITPGSNTTSTTAAVISTSGYFSSSTLFYSLPRMLDGENYTQIFSCGCPSSLVLAGALNNSLFQSQDWISTSGPCWVNAGADVRLDADPAAGYITLSPGFLADASSGAIFIAQAFNGCANGSPQRPAQEREQTPDAENQAPMLSFKVFPNPTDGLITVDLHQPLTGDAAVMVTDITGKIMLQAAVSSDVTQYQLSLENLPAGVYLLFVTQHGERLKPQKVVKQ